MVTVNIVVLAGTVSEVPEVKTMPSGDQVARFRLHVPEAGKRVLPLPISAWDRLAPATDASDSSRAMRSSSAATWSGGSSGTEAEADR